MPAQESGSANEFMHQSSTEDLITRFESAERDAYQKPAEVLEYLGDLKGLTIMDIGAGSGYFTFPMAKAGAKVIAADVDDEFQNHIRKRIEEGGLENLGIELRKLPYDSPSLKKGEVDKVLLVNTYHHIENRVPYFKQVLAGLKAGGELVVIDYYKKELPVGLPVDHKISKEVVLKELREAGFKEIEENTKLLEYQFIIRAK
jgi:cyclopropane fatty-acyl-phospholipid synthase-like methyltransferase